MRISTNSYNIRSRNPSLFNYLTTSPSSTPHDATAYGKRAGEPDRKQRADHKLDSHHQPQDGRITQFETPIQDAQILKNLFEKSIQKLPFLPPVRMRIE